MEITDVLAESLVNRLSALLKKKIMITGLDGDVVASTNLLETGKHFEQFKEATDKNKEIEIQESFGKNSMPQGIILPVSYNNEVVGAIFIEDKPEEYTHYRHIISATAELLIHQNLVIDNFPYKDKIKDNFVFGLLHRRLSVEDSKVREEAELFDINLNRDKIVVIINAEGFWENLFGANLTATEDEKQTALSSYKKKLFTAFSRFFGKLSGCSISYFGSNTFVVMVDELYSIDGKEMVDTIRSTAAELKKSIEALFEDAKPKRILLGLGNFYRGRDGTILAYEEARRALNLGLSIGEERTIYHIDDLGMIATLAGGNKKWQENFVRRLLVKLLAEEYLLETVEVFFDKDMSLTQTAKQLNIHRNTLLYRLEKIKKITGLDPRKFNDAIELKVALILNRVLFLGKTSVNQA